MQAWTVSVRTSRSGGKMDKRRGKRPLRRRGERQPEGRVGAQVPSSSSSPYLRVNHRLPLSYYCRTRVSASRDVSEGSLGAQLSPDGKMGRTTFPTWPFGFVARPFERGCRTPCSLHSRLSRLSLGPNEQIPRWSPPSDHYIPDTTWDKWIAPLRGGKFSILKEAGRDAHPPRCSPSKALGRGQRRQPTTARGRHDVIDRQVQMFYECPERLFVSFSFEMKSVRSVEYRHCVFFNCFNEVGGTLNPLGGHSETWLRRIMKINTWTLAAKMENGNTPGYILNRGWKRGLRS